jgi:acyl-CoA oxidase|eukprot:CAMPEP_0168315834 /NCGR_PEP_ID=MMETSP0210-20121227/12892_1 /TAXON_ID=40633 /ORGANISM="Condylostoma magnum, Strain COL2" /LENGTH=76 /DNA_ID=CAMNT_0008291897 /DNA_START=631 /DNA_END=861 /DNA_ORIENTATION=+
MAIISAKLIIGEQDNGIHFFLVPIRNNVTHATLPGVHIGDMGPKIGINGIDNGYIMFSSYWVGYDSLLDKIGYVDD